MEKIIRRRLPMIHWITAHSQKPDFINQLSAFIFTSLHSSIKHDCICRSHSISESEEWSYLPSDSLIVMQCDLAARHTIEQAQRAIASGWLIPAKGSWGSEKYPFVQPTERAAEIEAHCAEKYPPSKEDAETILNLKIDIKSQQSDTWDFVFKDFENNKERKITCINHDTRVLFPVMYGGQTYEIITKAGSKYTARVDDSREFMAEGLEWRTIGSDKCGNLEQYFVAGWKRLD